MKKVIVVHDPKMFTLGGPGVEVVSSKDYLTSPRFAQMKNTRIFNLARSFVYQSRGYYVSLLAEARDQKVIPSAKTILDLKNPSIVKVLSRDLDDVIQHTLAHKEKHDFVLSMYFGRNVNPKYDKLSHELYKAFEAPLLRARFVKGEKWELRSVRPVPYNDIPEEHLPLLRKFAADYFGKKRYDTARGDKSAYDLAILVNPDDDAAPSNKRAVVKFRQAAEELGFRVEIIGPGDIDRLAEYDALLIRENTHVNNHTYRMARKAEQEGLAVIDSPAAILKCNNKVFLAEVMEAHGVPTPKTMVVHSENRHEVAERMGLPVVLKLPDSTFSRGVVKAKTAEELEKHLDEILGSSDLAVAQEYMPSDYDWRIGVLDGKVLYACKYYMAQGHWQIYNWASETKHDETGNFDTVKVADLPEDITQAALKAVQAMGCHEGLYGVDVKEYQSKAYVIEVNECPNIDHGIEDVELGDEIYRRIIASMKTVIERKIGIKPAADAVQH
ncbi:MAG: RimK family protein [Flavobacteriales bacterium]|jgi:glutathione synthase/RimK-type ligase-like ATP-grasp enzyme|nr:RimK family protein [Flavobacteriales bacterium]